MSIDGLSALTRCETYGESSASNALIQGNNVEVLTLLADRLAGKVGCVYIDPPYNNGETYNHYMDDKDHEEWLNDLSRVLRLLKPLMAENGSIWISIDDTEMHYLKVAADSVFCRENFLATIVWQHRTTRENRSIFSRNHEFILVYAIDPKIFKERRNLLPTPIDLLERYRNPDNDPQGPWQSITANVQAGHATDSQFYLLRSPNGKLHSPPNGRCWVYTETKMNEEIRKGRIWFGRDGNGVPRIKRYLCESSLGITPETLWFANDAGTTRTAKRHLLDLFPGDVVFDTPKPERLMRNILEVASDEGDLVLDAYLGSGSTASVAHKMNRRYIGIELESAIVDYAAGRLRKVIEGEQGGISKLVGWRGGGGFSVYKISKEPIDGLYHRQSMHV